MQEVTRYHYTALDGTRLYDVVRFEPKDFRPQMPDGTWGLTVPRVLYRLPDVVAHRKDGFVWVTEGEKDADRLADEGLCSTTAGAAKAWAATDTAPLHGAWGIVVVPDCDEAGKGLATAIANSTYPETRTVQVLDLGGGDGYDVSDFLDEHGVGALMTLRSETPPWKPTPTQRRRGRPIRGMRQRGRVTSIMPGLHYNIDDLEYELGTSTGHGYSRVVWCPAHDDKGTTPGLSLTYIDDETTLAYCHSGCDFLAIREAVTKRMETQ